MAKKAKFQEGLGELIDGLEILESELPEINRYAIATIADRAVEIARNKIEQGGDPSVGHSDDTDELTSKLSKGRRSTGSELNETGKLKNSIRITSNTIAMGKIHVNIGSDLIYAHILEYGGFPFGAVGPPPAGFIPPRPYLRPAIQEAIWEALGSGFDKKIARAYELSLTSKKRKKGKNEWKKAFE